jgi:phosphatidate phosphatase PAH1
LKTFINIGEKSLLGGAMDIIVVELPNGHLRSSSFHVRFGSTQVLTSKNVNIYIYINGKKKDVRMKLAKSGDAYFSLDKVDQYILSQSNLKLPDDENNDYYYMNTNFKKFTEDKHCSLFPTEEQLLKMELKEGKNEVCFATDTTLGGIQVLKTNLYFWKYNVKIILWDIDGTITRSDILGVILPRIGINWSHDDVIELIDKMAKNGYKIIYLTARAIFQSEATRKFLKNLEKNGIKLPDGPIIMDPDGLFSSFKKGIIERKQHMIKILSLLEIKNMFDMDISNNNPIFYAGFGNKETDAIAYRYFGIPLTKIFIINHQSNVIQLGEKEKTTYSKLIESFDQNFPKIE